MPILAIFIYSINTQIPFFQKPKERTCFVCDKSPRIESIFCSDECIGSHVESAKEFLLKTKPKHVTTTKKVRFVYERMHRWIKMNCFKN